jgi:hypothetical protein
MYVGVNVCMSLNFVSLNMFVFLCVCVLLHPYTYKPAIIVCFLFTHTQSAVWRSSDFFSFTGKLTNAELELFALKYVSESANRNWRTVRLRVFVCCGACVCVCVCVICALHVSLCAYAGQFRQAAGARAREIETKGRQQEENPRLKNSTSQGIYTTYYTTREEKYNPPTRVCVCVVCAQ